MKAYQQYRHKAKIGNFLAIALHLLDESVLEGTRYILRYMLKNKAMCELLSVYKRTK